MTAHLDPTVDPQPDSIVGTGSPGIAGSSDIAGSSGIAGRRLRLSPSRASDFKSCPLKFRFRAIDRLPEPPSPAAARGTLVHTALERLFGLEPPQRTVDGAVASLPELWRDLVGSRPEYADLVPEADLPDWLAAAAGLVRTYFTMENPAGFNPDACEVHLEVELPGDVPTHGYIDRLDLSPDGLIRIVDYKTGKSPKPAFAADALFQLKFYALMLYRLRGIIAARLRLIYLGNGQILEDSPTEASLLAFEQQVVALWRAIRHAVDTGDFPPRRSRLCDWCSFQQWCPEFGGTPPPYPAA